MIMHRSAPTSAAAALLLLLPLLRLYAADAQRLSLPPLWSFSADLSFPSSSSSLNSYTDIAPFSLFAPILSSPAFASGSKGFSLGFLSSFQSPSSSPSHISLSICLGVLQQQSSSNGGAPFLVPVWTLNTTTPLQQRGKLVKLQVDDNKQLLLADGDGSVVWTWSNVDSMQIQSNGNLVIYDSRNQSIWQSFEHPSDCLLQGQRLRMGMELTSRNNMYKVTMQAGGVAYYQVSTNPWPLVYWAYLPNKTLNNYFWDMRGAFSLDKSAPVNLTASLASPTCATPNTSLAYLVLDGDRYVAQDACANVNSGLLNTTMDLMRLDNDGITRDYSVHELLNSSYVITSSNAEYRPCFSPNVCGAYGICSTSNTFGKSVIHNCRCPAEEDNKSLRDAFTLIDVSNPSEGCRRNVDLKCRQVASQSLVEIKNVAYMSMLSLFERTWVYNIKSLEDCKASCASNCSCSGLLYHTKSSFCLPFGDHSLSNLSFLSLGSDEHIAFVKIQQSEAKSKVRSIIVVIAVVLPVVVIIMVLSALYWNWRKSIDSESKLAEDELLSVLSMLPTRYSYRELVRFTKGFRKRLGSGGYGAVYEGVLPDGRRVAVKNIYLQSQGQKEFLAEIASIGGTCHMNIVSLFGFCLEKRHRLLVYEYMENGSLDTWLFCHEGEQQLSVMSWERRYNVALGTARGLAYLHEDCPKPILHFDVKPQNILLDGNFEAKLADFGLAKLVAREQSSVMTAVRGTPGYIAPESLLHSIVSKKCDVYSFGMVLLELVSGRKNVEVGLMGKEDWYFPKWAAKKIREGNIAALIDRRLVATCLEEWDTCHEDGTMEQLKTAVRVALLCIQEEPERRPTMTTVCGMLEGSIALPEDIPTVCVTQIPFYKIDSSGTIEVVQYPLEQRG